MGARKRNSSEKLKEVKKSMAIAKLNNCPTSPRKMRLVADLVRGEDVYNALNILKFSPKHASRNLEKLLLSAINNWEQKNEGEDAAEANLVVKSIHVDEKVNYEHFENCLKQACFQVLQKVTNTRPIYHARKKLTIRYI